MTYTWIVGGGAAQTTTTGSLSISSVAVGSTTYSVTVTNANGCTSAAKTGTITVHGLPTISLASGSTNQTVNSGTAISQIKYNTTNATGASLSNYPTGVSGSWSSGVYTISGTPTATGTFTYTVTTTNGNGCTNASATGTITVNASCTNCTNWTTCSSTSSYQYSSVGNNYYYYNGSSRVQDGTRNGFTMISNVSYENSTTMNWQTASTYCQSKGTGWRLPTLNELYCMCNNNSSLPGGYTTGNAYWSATQDSSNIYNYYVVNLHNCTVTYHSYPNDRYVKCVK
jgi:hypothetical protein